MARRKSDSVKWTLVLVLVVFSSVVFSRPQESDLSINITNTETNKPTETTIRYGYYKNGINNPRSKLPSEIFTNHRDKVKSINYFRFSDNSKVGNPIISTSNVSKRTNRLIHRINNIKQNIQQRKINQINKNADFFTEPALTKRNARFNKNTNIKKVLTKWVDNVKDEDLNISQESSISSETDDINLANLLDANVNHENSATIIEYLNENTKHQQYSTDLNDKRLTYSYTKPRPQYTEESQVYSDGFHLIGNTYPTRPMYMFTTPTPTPIITNVGYPQQWPEYIRPQKKPTTRKPIKSTTVNYPYNYHNTINNHNPSYPGNNFDVTTFPPSSAYTDRIVIRPQEYSADPDECPTIFLTLNNTFQGQAKEACPDLNIAVNTNVINKNVVVESDEDTDTTLTDVFGLPTDDESESDEAPNDYAESQENEDDDDDDSEDNASVEDLQFSSYNAANDVNAESSEPGNFAAPSTSLSTYSRPNRPSTSSDDDGLSFSSLIDFFRPAVGAFSWLAAINPLSFGAISFFLTPFILLLAGASGLATLFAPFSGRAHETFVYTPKWQQHDGYRTSYLESFPNNKRWNGLPRNVKSAENLKTGSKTTTWTDSVKDFLERLTTNLRISNRRIRQKNR